MREMRPGPSALSFIERIMRLVMPPLDGSEWLCVVSTDGELQVRDPFASQLLSVLFAGREDVKFRYIRAFDWRKEERPQGVRNLALIGRAMLYATGVFGWLARELQKQMWGEFVNKGTPFAADSILYEDSVYTRREVAMAGASRRWFDVDYALLIFRRVEIDGVSYNVFNPCGLGGVGTSMLIWILSRPALRDALLAQISRICGNLDGLRPDLGFEIVVKIWVPDSRDLPDLLNRLQEPIKPGKLDELPYRFQAELVAISRADGAPAIWKLGTPRLSYEINGSNGHVSLGSWSKTVSKLGIQLMQMLDGKQRGVSNRELCAVLYPDSENALGNLRGLTSRTNRALRNGDPKGQPPRVRIRGTDGRHYMEVYGS